MIANQNDKDFAVDIDATEREIAIAALERRRAAFHEAGHLVLYSRFGGLGRAAVWPNTATAVRNGEMAWRGQFQMWAKPGTGENGRRHEGLLLARP